MTTAIKNLDRALDQGIELRDSVVGTFATSATYPQFMYRVDEEHCDCEGFHYRGHCKHHALFMASSLFRSLSYFVK